MTSRCPAVPARPLPRGVVGACAEQRGEGGEDRVQDGELVQQPFSRCFCRRCSFPRRKALFLFLMWPWGSQMCLTWRAQRLRQCLGCWDDAEGEWLASSPSPRALLPADAGPRPAPPPPASPRTSQLLCLCPLPACSPQGGCLPLSSWGARSPPCRSTMPTPFPLLVEGLSRPPFNPGMSRAAPLLCQALSCLLPSLLC